jgi:mono/diheme cytochrome c family protein
MLRAATQKQSGTLNRTVKVLLILLAPLMLSAEEPVRYGRDVLPILSANCFSCHGPDDGSRQAGLRLDLEAEAKAKRARGIPIVPGKPEQSLILARMTHTNPNVVMPPPGAHRHVTPDQIETLRRWISEGAKWGRHWSYEPVIKPSTANGQQPIDALVSAALAKKGLSLRPAAPPQSLVRRLWLDLTGLPTTPEIADRFAAAASPAAYERMVDDLLGKPQFGEHWARMWLDLARYADTQGYEKDNRRTIWRYRDWVIDAFNRNLPFDQFTIEQLAGDMLPDATLDQKIATGFHRNTMTNAEGGTDNEEFRVAAVMDRLETTFGVWMATTFNCCQCHTHKYDPFTQHEYYRFFAFLNNTVDADRDDDAPSIRAPTPEQEALTQRLQAEITPLQAQYDADTPELAAAQAAWEREAIARTVRWKVLDTTAIVAASGTGFTKKDDRSLLVTGNAVLTDTFTITASADLAGVTAIRLETLVDDSLQRRGPGRSQTGNFVLTEFRVAAGAKEGGDTRPIPLQGGWADHEQSGFPIAAALDGNDKTGWGISPQMARNHQAIFELKEPLTLAEGEQLTFVLDQQYGSQHTIGRVRLSVTDALPPVHKSILPDPIGVILAVEPEQRTNRQTGELKAYFRSIAPELQATREKLAELKAALPGVPTTLVIQELPQPRETNVLARGSFLSKGDKVSAGVPSVLHPLPGNEPANRLTAARWVVSRENPLTARVTMNRFWEQLFGRGLVETSEDFGTRGDKPSHPELLDWLAGEFMEPSRASVPWDMKRMLKLIVMSATYRQSPKVSAEILERDPHNRLLARGPRFRMEAEMLRDQALAASGLLSHKQGGPSVMPPQPDGVWSVPYSGEVWVTSKGEDKYRRALYTFWRRSAPYPAFMTFDAPSREVCVLRRPRSNTPLQALTTLNDPANIEAAQALARRAVSEGGATAADRATRLFRRCLSRAPSDAEVSRLLALFEREYQHYRQEPSAAKEMATSHLGPAPTGTDLSELAAWTVVANVVLNLDEALTK